MFTIISKKPMKLLMLMLLAAFVLTIVFDAARLIVFETVFAATDDFGPRINSAADPADAIYVSPDGNDSTATGSIEAPYKSINTALAAAASGDTIILRGGTYREGANVRVRLPNITIKSREGEWAVIDLTSYDSGNDEDSGVYFDVDSSGGKLQSVEVIGGFYAVSTETRWDWGDPNNRTGASNIIIEDCKLHDSRYDVIKVKPKCNNVTIRYNEIYNSGRAFDGNEHNGEDNAEGIDNVNGDNMYVHNNYIHDIISNAIYAKGGATDVLIENNRIETAYGAGIMLGFDASPEFFDLTVNPQYYENIRGIVRNNLIIDTGWEGIGFYASKDGQVYNNTLVNVANGGLYHSAIYFGITMQDWDPQALRPANLNPIIHHNVVVQPSANIRPTIEIRYANELGGLSALDGNPIMSNNCYFIAGKNATFTDNRPGSILTNAGLSAWQSHIGGDSGSIEVDPVLDPDYITTNPLCAGMGYAFELAPTYLAFASPSPYTYPNATVGYSNMSMAQIFTITNIGTQPLTGLTAALNSQDFEISTPLSANTILLPGTATIAVRPKNALAAGSYSGTLIIRWDNDGGAGLAVSLGFAVGNELVFPQLTLSADPLTSQIYPGNVVLRATLSGAAPDNGGKTVVFNINGSLYNASTNASGIAVYTAADPAPGLYSFGAAFAGDIDNAPAAAAAITGYTVYKGTGSALNKPAASLIGGNGFIAAATLVSPTGQMIEYAVGTNSMTPGAWQSSKVFTGLAPGTDYYIFVRSAENSAYSAGTPAVSDAVRTLTTGEQIFDIAGFYHETGQLSVGKGDIIVVGQRIYRVTANTITISYWSQSTLAGAISWWTEYLDSYASSGMLEIIAMDDPVAVTGMIKSFYPLNSAIIRLMQGDVVKYELTVKEEPGYGQVDRTFTFPAIEPDTYSLVIKKPAHTSFTVQSVIVGNTDLDLTADSRPEVRLMSLRCGDINGDGLINDADLTVLWRAGNYNKKAGEAENHLCDLNGDGLINDADLTILWLAYNYNRGPIIVP
ncbi:MAG: right-handed parallel beta-helix repeat-containing protein [Clostridiales bacterium]|nr:right-handed parallel beta-helix repeat-containing protein [Clostridiales bacterium]